jgi:farnesyl diphosphate synthase
MLCTQVGRDIEENKCGWLIVQAMKYCSPEQLAQLEQYYGRDNAEAVAIVKAIYRDVNLEAKFRAYEEESFAKITSMIEVADARIPRAVFTNLLAKIYKRNL